MMTIVENIRVKRIKRHVSIRRQKHCDEQRKYNQVRNNICGIPITTNVYFQTKLSG